MQSGLPERSDGVCTLSDQTVALFFLSLSEGTIFVMRRHLWL